MNLKVKRHELKYFLNFAQENILKNKLKYLLKEDAHNGNSDGYLVRSLYFDSDDNECFHEKCAGNMVRNKYRLRTYGGINSQVKFEIKRKANDYVDKVSSSISVNDAREVIKGNIDVLLKYNNDILNEIYTTFKSKNYRPQVIVDYYRYAFVMDIFDIRITLDKYISFNRSNFDLFNKHLNTTPVFLDEHKVVLEVKFNHFLPPVIKNLLALESVNRTSISKYVLSRRTI